MSCTKCKEPHQSGPKFQFGTETILLRESKPIPKALHPRISLRSFGSFSQLKVLRCHTRLARKSALRSRTSVLNLPIPLRHRFFSALATNFHHDCAFPSPNADPSRILVARIPRRTFSCFGSYPPGGHAKHGPLRPRGRLLLQLLSVEDKTRLLKNVRTSPLRFALVGHNMRQATRFFPAEQSWSRPTLPARRSRRTRK
jgi:hypothetical protein